MRGRKTIAVIGEGITEKYYIESLKGLSPFNIMPRELGIKASSLKSLAKHIDLCTKKGFDEVYCLIDMDGKTSGKSKDDYLILKKKYHNKIFSKKSQGLESKVFFIETERCTELWFLYYFTGSAITRKFNTYKELEKELRKYRPDYEKSVKYFKGQGNIHKRFENEVPKGSIKKAYNNSKASLASNKNDKRGYSYSEMHVLIKALGIYSDE
ncbi:RloB family protein [Tenacibaculum finnmarkense]|uniref:RloB family protein n=1 Tax=Tenacibaculum finnmarkense TaxID=2781243 RepID=UPI00187B24FA|nr:RloB family protein [Tenacibaculum finnmarkense]MBE7659178.1 RloB domain-containing protein [Tenacibaculum finnmarkense genomovar finnmarkense]MCD8411480.1 RloB family protein [Tenacibaculum finnmarkense genomovar ulcerans]MCG8207310.1 RloB domain-containing protein [Tenacibaculum finnmarkense genomovar finnmarkense]MCG8251269.1 RloB domain-containing protein [Tenacibaculum finnmarkense genomovar finnmarkense]MCG8723481.1 RloB domain-containing protein [Tenacibaculum finnmarkense]